MLARRRFCHCRLAFTLLEVVVITAIILILFALIAATLQRAQTATYTKVDVSSLRQIGMARQMYDSDYGTEILTTAPLVRAGLLDKRLLCSNLDPSFEGIANDFRNMTHSPEDPTTLYKDSFLPAPAVCLPNALEELPATKGYGWLVSFAGSESAGDGSGQPKFVGTYQRLLTDGSVQTRHHHLLQDFPVGTLRAYQNMVWWFTDEDKVFDAGLR